MKKVIISVFLVFPSILIAQVVDSSTKSSFEIGLGTRLNAPLKIEHNGEEFLKSHITPAPMLFIAWNSRRNGCGMSFSTFLNLSWHGYWFSYEVPIPEENVLFGAYSEIESFRDISLFPETLTFGCQVLKTKRLSKNRNLTFGFGLNAGLIPAHENSSSSSYWHTDIDTIRVTVFQEGTRLDVSTLYINMATSFGYMFKLGKRYNKVNLGINLSNDKIAEGTYAFNLYPKESYGKIYTRNFYTTISYSLFLRKY